MTTAIILAAGVGKRVGSSIPKQFIEVLGRPILAYTLECYQKNSSIDAIEIVGHSDYLDEIHEIVSRYHIDKTRWIVSGGDSFQESTMRGIYHLRDMLADDDIVVISFGVSPLTSDEVIDDSIRVAGLHGSGICSEDMVLCTCVKDDEHSTTQAISRESIKGFASPWTFRYGEVYSAYRQAESMGILNDIEPHTTSLYLALGRRLWFSKSDGHNFKITTREDLERFEGILLYRQRHGQT
jgi:2-C-methyl-D-erythritol 4-phosphate cytidylyltransferase